MKILGDTHMDGFPERPWHTDARAEEVPQGGAGTCHPQVSRFCGFTFSNSWAECLLPCAACLATDSSFLSLPSGVHPGQCGLVCCVD